MHSLNWALRDHSPREKALLVSYRDQEGTVCPQSNSSCCWRWDKGYQLPGSAERKLCILMLRPAALLDRHRNLNMSSGGHQRPFWSQHKWNANRKWPKDAWHWCSHLCQIIPIVSVPAVEILYHCVVISAGLIVSGFCVQNCSFQFAIINEWNYKY